MKHRPVYLTPILSPIIHAAVIHVPHATIRINREIQMTSTRRPVYTYGK